MIILPEVIEIPTKPESQRHPGRKKRVAGYCQVSTDSEDQTSSIELQERYFTDLININEEWENTGVFAGRASGLHAKQCSEFARLVRLCQHGQVDLLLAKSISRF